MITRRSNFAGVHSDLVKVVELASTYLNFNIVIIQGVRTAAQHAANVKSGATRTTRSRHVMGNNKSGHASAIDMAPVLGKTIPWQRFDLFKAMNVAMMKASKKLGIPIEWGGDWKKFQDLNHWQLPWGTHP